MGIINAFYAFLHSCCVFWFKTHKNAVVILLYLQNISQSFKKQKNNPPPHTITQVNKCVTSSVQAAAVESEISSASPEAWLSQRSTLHSITFNNSTYQCSDWSCGRGWVWWPCSAAPRQQHSSRPGADGYWWGAGGVGTRQALPQWPWSASLS